MAVVACAATGTAILGVLQYWFDFRLVRQVVRPAAAFANKNMAAQFIVLGCPATVFSVIAVERWAIRECFACGLALQLAYLFFTFTRAAWMALMGELLLAAFVFALFVVRRKLDLHFPRNPFLVLVTAGALALGMIHFSPHGWQWCWEEVTGRFSGVWVPASDVLSSAFQQSDEGRIGDDGDDGLDGLVPVSPGTDPTASKRLTWYRNAMSLVRDDPMIGHGLGNYPVVYPESNLLGPLDENMHLGKVPLKAHNDYIQITVETGLVGLALILWLICCLDGPASARRSILLQAGAALVALTGLGINALFSFPVYLAVPAFLAAVYSVALTSAAGNVRSRRSQERRGNQTREQESAGPSLGQTVSARGAGLGILVFALSLLTLGGLVLSHRWIAADRHFQEQRLAYDEGAWQEGHSDGSAGPEEQSLPEGYLPVFRPRILS